MIGAHVSVYMQSQLTMLGGDTPLSGQCMPMYIIILDYSILWSTMNFLISNNSHLHVFRCLFASSKA